MKRYIGILTFIICIFLILSTCKNNESKENKNIIDSQKNSITIKYINSRRIPHNQIICTLINKNDNEYIINVETIAMIYQEQNWDLNDENTRKYVESEGYKNSQIDLKNEMEEYAKENINNIIEIEKDFFENIYNKLLEIDLIKVVQEEIIGLDGYTVIIEFSLNDKIETIDVWCPSDRSGEVEKINEIVLEVFSKANVSQWY
jgi:hypothetical protein